MWLEDRLREHGDRSALIDSKGSAWTYDQLLRTSLVVTGRASPLIGGYSFDNVSSFLHLAFQGKIVVPLSSYDQDKADVAASSPLYDELDGPGLVLFSSGSSGKPKAVLLDLAKLLEKFRRRRDRLTTLAFLLWDHIGGVNTMLYTLANGGTLVDPGNRDPEVVCAAIARDRVELLPTSPTFVNLLLLSGAHERHDLSSLRKVTYGTERMSQDVLDRAREALPGVEFQQTYGSSEFGILRSRSMSSGSRWVRLGGEGVELKVEDGRLKVRAESAMVGYLNAPSPFDAEGWYDTGDLVEVREVDGLVYYRFMGRDSDVVNVGGLKVNPARVEDVLMSHPGVTDATVFGRDSSLVGQVVVARYDGAAKPRELRRWCAARLEDHEVPVRFERGVEIGERHKKVRR